MSKAKDTIAETINDRVVFEELYKKAPIKVSTSKFYKILKSTDILLYGCSGTGKTYLANLIAQSLGLSQIKVKGPELLNKYIGASEEAVRNVFEKAQKQKPCLIIFDEFDAIVPCRNSGQASVTDRVVNQFLCYLDGVEDVEGVFVLAITARPDLIDPAIIRPGRVDQHIRCDLPNNEERATFCKKFLPLLNIDKTLFSDPKKLENLVEKTNGFSYGNMVGVLRALQVDTFSKLSEYEKLNETEKSKIDSKIYS